MTGSAGQPFPALAINMNQPSTLLHWSIFDVTVANLATLGRLVAYSHAGVEPRITGIGPVPAVRKVLDRAALRSMRSTCSR